MRFISFFMLLFLLTVACAARTVLAEATLTENRETFKYEVRANKPISEDPNYKSLPIAPKGYREHALLIMLTQKSKEEIEKTGLVSTSGCSASFIDVKGKKAILTSNHCLNDSSFYPVFMGFEGSYNQTHFDYGQAEMLESIKKTNTFFDVVLFNESRPEIVNNRFYKDLNMAKKAPAVGSMLRIVGFPGFYGPTDIRCPYKGNSFSRSPETPEHALLGRMDCDLDATTELGGMSGASVLNMQNEVVGVFVRSGNEGRDHKLYFVHLLEDDVQVNSVGALVIVPTIIGKIRTQMITPKNNIFTCDVLISPQGYIQGKAACVDPTGSFQDLTIEFTDAGIFIKQYSRP